MIAKPNKPFLDTTALAMSLLRYLAETPEDPYGNPALDAWEAEHNPDYRTRSRVLLHLFNEGLIENPGSARATNHHRDIKPILITKAGSDLAERALASGNPGTLDKSASVVATSMPGTKPQQDESTIPRIGWFTAIVGIATIVGAIATVIGLLPNADSDDIPPSGVTLDSPVTSEPAVETTPTSETISDSSETNDIETTLANEIETTFPETTKPPSDIPPEAPVEPQTEEQAEIEEARENMIRQEAETQAEIEEAQENMRN